MCLWTRWDHLGLSHNKMVPGEQPKKEEDQPEINLLQDQKAYLIKREEQQYNSVGNDWFYY